MKLLLLQLLAACAVCCGCRFHSTTASPSDDGSSSRIIEAQPQLASERGSSRWIVETFFSKQEFPESDRYYKREMGKYAGRPPMGAYMPAGFRLTVVLLEESAEHAIYRATYSHTSKPGDWYAYLDRSDGPWRLAAVRCLALPAFLRDLFAQLRAKPNRTEEEESELQRMELLFSSDSELRAFLKDRVSQFDALAKLITNGAAKDSYAHLLKQVRISDGSVDSAGRVVLTIGGILDNSVGFMFVPSSSSPPKMTPEEFILVESILGMWYLFKTT